MAKIAPPTIASVLASKSVAAPTASVAKSTTTPAPSMATGSTIGSIGYYTGQWMSLADAQAARKNFISAQSWTPSSGDTISYTYSWPLPDEPTAQVAKWSALYNAQWQRTDFSGRVIPNSPNATVWSNKNVVSGVKTNAPVIRDANINRVQVWKLVSNFKDALSTSKWDKASYRNSINYDSLSPYDKEVADRLFNLTPVKPPAVVKPVVATAPNIATNWYTADSPFRWGPSGKVVSVVWYTDNPDWTTTNKLSDWTTSTIRYTKNTDWSLTPKEVTDRTGLRAPTGVLPDNSVKAIRAANPWMTVADARAESLKRRTSNVPGTTPTDPLNYQDQYQKDVTDLTDTIKTQAEQDAAEQRRVADKNKRLANDFATEQEQTYNGALATFESDQKNLLKEYEGNRLNQVQGDLRQVLISRGVDISKVTPEQLIALSGTVGANAFGDISAAKTKATNAIDQARQTALAKISQLKANKVLNDTQYNTAIADINSKTAAQKNNLDLKLAELKFGINTNKAAETKTDQQNAVQNILSTAQAIGVTGSQLGIVQKFIANAKTTPDALNAFLTELQNPNSTLYTTLKSSEDAAVKQAQFANQLKQYEAETDRIKADASMTSATRPRSSGWSWSKTKVESF